MGTDQAYAAGEVAVEVPATSANLGPGFDTLGLALSLHDWVEATVTSGPRGPGAAVEIEVSGEGAATVPRDRGHLVVRAMDAAFAAMSVPAPSLRLVCRNALPHSRGLGSSAAAVVAGVVAARALVEDGAGRLPDAALLDLASDLEGHPDNVAPAVLGGFVISGREASGRWYAVPSPVDERIRAVAMVPPDGVATETARGLLPATVPHADAAANSGRTALLVAALASRPDLLWEATREWLHQEQRRPAMPRTLEVVGDLRARGHAAVVSGAGPSVLVLTAHETAPLAALAPAGWSVHELAPTPVGARVIR